MSPELEIHYADEWAALYVDGNLDPDSVGDSYLAEEKILRMLNVKRVSDDAFMRGQNHREGVASTLKEIEEYRNERLNREADVEALRLRAQALLDEADKLERGGQ